MPPEFLSLSREQMADLIILAREENAVLRNQLTESEKLVHFMQQKFFRPTSEKMPYVEKDGVQQNFLATPVEQQVETPAAPEEIVVAAHTKRKKGHGRKPIPHDLPTEERIIHARPEDKIGPNGEALILLRYEISEKIDLTPSILRRLITKREVWGLPDTRETAFIAPVEPCLIPKGKATDGFIIDVLINKYQLSLPLYRQVIALNARGADINPTWMGELVKQVAPIYEPIYNAMRDQLLSQRLILVDETPIKQAHAIIAANGKPSKDLRTSYYWAWLGGDPDTSQCFIYFSPTRSQQAIRDVLHIPDDDIPWEKNNCIALLLCDGYGAYNIMSTIPMRDESKRIVRIACWAHVRRDIKDVADMGNTHAAELLTLINQLYANERALRRDNDKHHRTGDAAAQYCLTQRQNMAKPLTEKIKTLLDKHSTTYPASSNMCKAINYARNLWDNLIVFLDHPDVPLDNNAAERAIRPLAVGRKNWLFVGSEDAGKWSAIFFSLIESCRLQKIDPRTYFHHITPILVAGGEMNYHALTPLALKNTLAGKR
jgi:transposase